MESTIFIVVNSFGKGGAELSLAILAAELSKLKHRVFYIALWKEVNSYDFDWLRETGANVCILSNSRSNYLTRFIKLFKLIKQNRPVFIYSAMLNSNIISQIFSFIHSIPHAASIRNNPATYYGKTWHKKLIFSLGMVFQRNIVFISSKSKSEYLQSTYGKLLRKKRNYVLHNPIKADSRINDEFLRNKFRSIKEKLNAFLIGDSDVVIKLVIASRLVNGKGVMEMLEQSKDVFQNSRLHLHIYGTGILETKIKEYIFKEFPKKNVILMGYEKDPYKIYCNSEIFVFPSGSEGFGRAPFEALLMGSLVYCNEKVSIIDEFINDNLIWQDYSIYPNWDKALLKFSQIDPDHCVQLTKQVTNMLSPKTHATEFEKMIEFFVIDYSRKNAG
ncbi:MAG TPA: glycosyltransferase [Sphingobacteriaceae bacterium]